MRAINIGARTYGSVKYAKNVLSLDEELNYH